LPVLFFINAVFYFGVAQGEQEHSKGQNRFELSNIRNSILVEKANQNTREFMLTQSKSLNSVIRPLVKNSNKRSYYRHNSWGWSYRARASLLAYRMFGDMKHVNEVLIGALYYIELDNWNTWKREGDQWFNEITTVGLIATPILDLLLLAKEDSEVQRAIAPHSEALLNIVLQRVSGFDDLYFEVKDSAYYIQPLNQKVEPLNHMAAFVLALSRLYELTGDEQWYRIVERITNFWLSTVVYKPNNSLSWAYAPSYNDTKQNAETFWKASVTIEIAMAAHKIGVPLPDDYLGRVKRTLTENVLLKGDRYAVSKRIDGKTVSTYERFKERVKLTLGIEHAPVSEMVFKRSPVIGMWHILDCAVEPVDELDSQLFELNPNFAVANSRSLYGVVYGLYARSGFCKSKKT